MKDQEIYTEKDKWNAPYLLACSFNGLIKFEGNDYRNGILYWNFSPQTIAIELVNRLETNTEPKIRLRDFIQAIDSFWKQISKARNGEIRNVGNT